MKLSMESLNKAIELEEHFCKKYEELHGEESILDMAIISFLQELKEYREKEMNEDLWDKLWRKLLLCFPGSYINHKMEFVAHPGAGEYFQLMDCNTELDVKCKILEWLSRGCHKTDPFNTKKKNAEFHEFMLRCVNKYLGTSFTEEDMKEIYTYLGNRCNHEKTVQFIESGYDFKILKGE